MISACIITYNHERFIEECILSAINQKVDCEYEIVIGDDCSSDSTSDICKRYQEKFPNLIKYFRREKNLGVIGNWIQTIADAKGDYISLCEGDDYWVDTSKLDKQYKFLRNNSEFSMCFSRVRVKYEEETQKLYQFPNPQRIKLTFNDIIFNHYIPTCSLFFKKSKLPSNFPSIWLFHLIMIDIPLELMLSSTGFVYFFDQEMSVYRKHGNGITSNAQMQKRGRNSYIIMYRNLLNELPSKHSFVIILMLFKMQVGRLLDFIREMKKSNTRIA